MAMPYSSVAMKIEKLALQSRATIHQAFRPTSDVSEYQYQLGYLLAIAEVQEFLTGGVSKRVRLMLMGERVLHDSQP